MTLIGTVLGAILGYAVSRHFARTATTELKTATDDLRRLQELMLYAFLNRDAKVEPVLDRQGKVIGITVGAVGKADTR